MSTVNLSCARIREIFFKLSTYLQSEAVFREFCGGGVLNGYNAYPHARSASRTAGGDRSAWTHRWGLLLPRRHIQGHSREAELGRAYDFDDRDLVRLVWGTRQTCRLACLQQAADREE